MLNVPEGTIAWRMHEARNRLTAAMASSRPTKTGALSGDLEALLQQQGLAWHYN